MGKKDKSKKKGKGAEKTAEKTEKKMKQKLKKATGEDDIEDIVKAIEAEEKKRQEVKEIQIPPPSHRANLSMLAHPENPELIFFGGEFFNGQKTLMYNDLLIYNTKRNEWSQVKSPGAPPPRCSHQAVISSQQGGQMWLFGGEFASATETQFYHYRDLWCYHFASRRWEKVSASGGPSSRSGHRMVLMKRHLVVFGGFHDNLRECKYFNDVHVFDLDKLTWKKVEVLGSPPSPRSGCIMFVLSDNRIVVFAGYSKEKGKKDAEKGVTHSDMFLLVPDKHDQGMTKWRWFNVKQVGHRPTPRTGMSVAATANSQKILVFGGVQDVEEDEEDLQGKFFNELFTVHVENEKATWIKVDYSGKKSGEKKSRRRKAKSEEGDDDVEGDMDELQLEDNEESTVTVEEGAFTITSTVATGGASSLDPSNLTVSTNEVSTSGLEAVNQPCPRFSASLAVKQGLLYLFGGMFEEGEITYTLKDFYSIDVNRLDEWNTIVASDIKSMDWVQSDTSDDEDSESGDEEEMEEDD